VLAVGQRAGDLVQTRFSSAVIHQQKPISSVLIRSVELRDRSDPVYHFREDDFTVFIVKFAWEPMTSRNRLLKKFLEDNFFEVQQRGIAFLGASKFVVDII
jgi:hypothetical protein